MNSGCRRTAWTRLDLRSLFKIPEDSEAEVSVEVLSDLSGAAAHMTLDYHEGRPGVTKRHKGTLWMEQKSPQK